MNYPLNINGVWPVVLTPFFDSGAIDWASLDRLIDWYIEAGVAGLFSVCLSSEMFQLGAEERISVVQRVIERSAGRVPVVATGAFGGAVAEQAHMVRIVAETGVSAVVVVTNQLAAETESDCVWKMRAEQLMAATDGIPLGLYECPVPYKRLLSPELISWAASTGRFVFHKDTSCNLAAIHSKLHAVAGSPLRWFNANCATLLDSLSKGAHGYCGIAANFMPHLYVWLCANYERHPGIADRLQSFLGVADAVVRYKYPASAKHFLKAEGVLSSTFCRTGNPDLSEEDLIILNQLKNSIAEWRASLQ